MNHTITVGDVLIIVGILVVLVGLGWFALWLMASMMSDQ